MSMEDILKALVDSRQQGGSNSPQADPMMGLIGGLLGGAQQGSGQQAGLNDMMGMLESVMGGQQAGQTSMAMNDPVMGMLQPFVKPLAQKARISPEIALVVVSFVAHKLLSHHPASGRDSNQFNLDDMLQQMSTGSINQDLLHSSGMVKELSKASGLDQETAVKSLDAAFGLLGKQFQGK